MKLQGITVIYCKYYDCKLTKTACIKRKLRAARLKAYMHGYSIRGTTNAELYADTSACIEKCKRR